MKAFGGYTSCRGWLTGKALPMTIFTVFLIAACLTLLWEVAPLARGEISLYPMLELLRRCLTLGFWVIIVSAYMTRTHVVDPARGLGETVFPMLVMLSAPAGVWLLGRAGMPHRLDLAWIGLLLTLLGYGVSLWALSHLRGSFAIMAEARRAVTSGPYQYVRHPLYLGETLTLLGLCLMIGTAIALLFWAACTGMQLVRARIEEAKLARQFAEYKTYLTRTRFILPGLY